MILLTGANGKSFDYITNYVAYNDIDKAETDNEMAYKLNSSKLEHVIGELKPSWEFGVERFLKEFLV